MEAQVVSNVQKGVRKSAKDSRFVIFVLRELCRRKADRMAACFVRQGVFLILMGLRNVNHAVLEKHNRMRAKRSVWLARRDPILIQ